MEYKYISLLAHKNSDVVISSRILVIRPLLLLHFHNFQGYIYKSTSSTLTLVNPTVLDITPGKAQII